MREEGFLHFGVLQLTRHVRARERERGMKVEGGRRRKEKILTSLAHKRQKHRALSLSFSLHRQQQAAVAPAAASWSRGRHHRSLDDNESSRGNSFDALRLGSGLGAEGWRRVFGGIPASHAQGRRSRPPRRPSFLLLATAATAAHLLPHLPGLGHGGPDRPVPVPR